MFYQIRAAWRVFKFALTLIGIVVRLLTLEAFGRLNDGNRLRLRAGWARQAMRVVGFKLVIKGSYPKDETFLFVGNHRSTLDPLLAFAAIEAWPVAKMWVKDFPLIGKGSELTGIIFVDKESRTSRTKAKTLLLEELKKGNSTLIYPEGHTHADPYTRTFHKGAYDQAVSGGFRVVPFVLEYRDTRDYWVREQSIVKHFMTRFGKSRHDVHLEIGEPISSDNAWTLMRKSRAWIDEAMERVHRNWGNTQYDGLERPLHERPANQSAGSQV